MNGENRIQDIQSGGGGKAMMNKLKIADFPETWSVSLSDIQTHEN